MPYAYRNISAEWNVQTGKMTMPSFRSKDNNTLRIMGIEAMRGLAALAVLFYHYTSRYSDIFDRQGDASLRFDAGRLGVEMFFMISGFVMSQSIATRSGGLVAMRKLL